MKFQITVLLFIILSASLNCQNENANKTFDSIYYDVAVNVASTDPIKALHIADSLHLHAQDETQKLRSSMLIADLLEKQGKRQEAIKNALSALTKAERMKDYQWQAKIYGFLSTQYRHLGLLDQGKIYLRKGIAVSANIEDKLLASQFRGMTYQEMAYYAWEEEKYKEAIEHVEMATLSFDLLPDGRFKAFLLGSNEEMYGRSLAGLKDYEQAKLHYRKSFNYFKSSGAEETQWGATSYQGLGNVFLKQNLLDSAEVYLKLALIISEKTSHNALKERVFRDMAFYYRERNKIDSFAFYENKYNAILQGNISSTKRSVNSEFNRINSETKREFPFHIYLLWGAGFLFAAGVVIYTKRKVWFKAEDAERTRENGTDNALVLSQKTEKELLEKLEDFEASKDYLDRNLSFSVLAGQLGTNAKYLSHLIKHHRQKDYNSYINELRIQYIVNKLETDPEYLNFKISYLAEESGFSSHSKFSSNFKRVVNLSPSEFIDSLRD